MCSGVSKSGSPADRAITSTPSRRRAAALAVIAMVGDGATLWMYPDSFWFIGSYVVYSALRRTYS